MTEEERKEQDDILKALINWFNGMEIESYIAGRVCLQLACQIIATQTDTKQELREKQVHCIDAMIGFTENYFDIREERLKGDK